MLDILLQRHRDAQAAKTFLTRLLGEYNLAWQGLYQRRAGIEATMSQAVRAFGLRQARYRGLKKTSLQHACIGAAINLVRVVDWISDKPRWRDRPAQFAALRPVA